ncbi:MAG: carbonic anhydrase [Flavobacteriales bacterium]|jgi:carbonic anhydrase
MNKLTDLFKNNEEWAESIKAEDPDFFTRLSKQQKPDYLWIGCSDSRVPANQIVGLSPGELFVHRNIANCVVHTDLNCLSVIYYAIQVLEVKHIIVSGHYGCGGVRAALEQTRFGLADHWIRNIRDVSFQHRDELKTLEDKQERIDRLCEMNVIQQVANVAHIPAVQKVWQEGKGLTIHGWIYDIKDGLLKDLIEPVHSLTQIAEQYHVFGDAPD